MHSYNFLKCEEILIRHLYVLIVVCIVAENDTRNVYLEWIQMNSTLVIVSLAFDMVFCCKTCFSFVSYFIKWKWYLIVIINPYQLRKCVYFSIFEINFWFRKVYAGTWKISDL